MPGEYWHAYHLVLQRGYDARVLTVRMNREGKKPWYLSQTGDHHRPMLPWLQNQISSLKWCCCDLQSYHLSLAKTQSILLVLWLVTLCFKRLSCKININKEILNQWALYVSGVRPSVIRWKKKVKPRWRKLTYYTCKGHKKFSSHFVRLKIVFLQFILFIKLLVHKTIILIFKLKSKHNIYSHSLQPPVNHTDKNNRKGLELMYYSL